MAGGDGRISSNEIQRSSYPPTEFIPNEFRTSDEIYKISSFIDHRAKTGQTTCFNEPVKISSISRSQQQIDDHQTEFLMFNLGREFILYEFSSIVQAHSTEPVDYRVYRPAHPVTCHDICQDVETNSLKILTGFANGQIQYINLETKEQKIFNENSYFDKTKVTCIKWLKSSRNQFAASFVSGILYIFDEELDHQQDLHYQPIYSEIKDDEKNFSISFLKQKCKSSRNPIARWSIGTGTLNEFAFSPDQRLFACVSQDGFLRIFHYEKMQLIAYMKSYFGGLLCVCWSPDARFLVTGGEDDLITVFHLSNDDQPSRVLCRGYGHTSWINAIAFQPNIKSFYRFASIGQDHRLCFWEIHDEILTNFSIDSRRCQMNNTSSYPVISTIFNGCSSFLSETSSNHSISTSKTSFSSFKSRLNFARYTSKSSETPARCLSMKKPRKLSLLHLNGTNSSSIAPAIESNLSTRRNTNDLTKSLFGTNLCPRFEDIPIIEPIVNEIIGFERLNGIVFSEKFLLTSSQDGLIGIWEKFHH